MNIRGYGLGYIEDITKRQRCFVWKLWASLYDSCIYVQFTMGLVASLKGVEASSAPPVSLNAIVPIRRWTSRHFLIAALQTLFMENIAQRRMYERSSLRRFASERRQWFAKVVWLTAGFYELMNRL